MTQTIDKLVIEKGDKVYEFTGEGSIEPGVPIPANTVDSNAIVDESVEMEDLSKKVKDEMVTSEDRVTQEDLDNFVV